MAQVVNTLPTPSGIWTAGQIATAVAEGDELGVAPATFARQIKQYTQTITPASVAAATCAEQSFTVTGLTTADTVFYNPPATGNATSAAQVRVSAANTLAVMYCNPTAGALTPGAGSAKIAAVQF
jgi:hypothetical protein